MSIHIRDAAYLHGLRAEDLSAVAGSQRPQYESYCWGASRTCNRVGFVRMRSTLTRRWPLLDHVGCVIWGAYVDRLNRQGVPIHRIPDWLILSLGYVLVVGGNSVVSKVAMPRIEFSQILVLTGGVCGAAGLATYLVTRPRLEWGGAGIILGTAAVMLALTSLVLLFSAVARGDVSRVVPIMSLCPLVAVVLSVVFLRERINPLHALGVVFGLVAVMLLRLG